MQYRRSSHAVPGGAISDHVLRWMFVGYLLLLGTGMKLPQHQAQALAPAVTTLPAAWVYAEKSRGLPWWLVAGIIVGLWVGAWLGSRFVTLVTVRTLRRFMAIAIFTMAAVMAWPTYAS